MKKPRPIIYRTKSTASGGRDGTAKTADGHLAVSLSTPKELGGAGGQGTNPEQLFASGYAACFSSAAKLVAAHEKIQLPDDFEITADVGIGPTEGGFAIDVELLISLPGMDKSQAETIINKAHQVCPYSNAIRGNVDVRLKLLE